MMNQGLRWALVALLASLLAVHATAGQDEITWLKGWPAAQAAAQTSGKLILVYIYQRNQNACLSMEDRTFTDDAVINAVSAFVPLALSSSGGANKDFCVKYGLLSKDTTKDKDGTMDAATIPAVLFLDSTGREYHRVYGAQPPSVFAQLLERMGKMKQHLEALSRNPNDARSNADLGNLYLNLERPELATPYLEAAVKLDPQNAAGARADAELDLIILSIPDAPGKAFPRLVAYQYNYRQTARGLEILWYMAVAALADGQKAQAMRILDDFAAIPPKIPDPKNPGKEINNPDYFHNRWCEAADLLRRQLLAADQKPPK